MSVFSNCAINLFFPLLEHDRPCQTDLSNHVVPLVAPEWKSLGEVLLPRHIVETKRLEIIEANNPRNVEECCRQMFIKWLDANKDVSWKQLITALQCPSVELHYAAEKIKKKLQKGKTISTNRLVITINVQ